MTGAVIITRHNFRISGGRGISWHRCDNWPFLVLFVFIQKSVNSGVVFCDLYEGVVSSVGVVHFCLLRVLLQDNQCCGRMIVGTTALFCSLAPRGPGGPWCCIRCTHNACSRRRGGGGGGQFRVGPQYGGRSTASFDHVGGCNFRVRVVSLGSGEKPVTRIARGQGLHAHKYWS